MPIPKGPQAFPREEYVQRLAKVKAYMERKGIQVLVVTSTANITYLSGYTAKSGYVPQALIVFLDRREPVFITRRMDAPAAIHQTYLDRDNVIGYPEALIANPDRDGYDAVIDLIAGEAPAKAGVGLDAKSLSPATVQKFGTRLPAATIVDCTHAVDWIRGVKSEREIATMREAAAISDAGMLRARDVIRPGVREADAAAEIVATLIRGADGKPGTDLRGFYLCASPRISTCHIPWAEDEFRHGSQVNLEFSGVRHGYTSPLMRTFSIGKPSDLVRRLHEAQRAGLEAALAAAQTGRTCGDVAAAFNRTLKTYGFEKESRCGYAVGIEWTEPTASLKEGDATILEPNMTFHLMLGNWIDEDLGYVISETFRVTDAGGESFTKLPRELFVL